MTILDFVQSLQEMKKAQIQWANSELNVRAEALKSIAIKIGEKSNTIAKELAKIQNLPEEFILQNEVLASQNKFEEVSRQTIPNNLIPKATGFISILTPEFFVFRILSEKLAPALLAGNGIFIHVSPKYASLKNIWLELLDPSWPIRIFDGGEDLAEILVSHPAIHAVSSYGTPEQGDKTLKLLAGTWKKAQITAGFHNSALILNDVDLSKVAESLVQSCFLGQGQLHWNISNILVTEAQLPEFQKLSDRASGGKSREPW